MRLQTALRGDVCRLIRNHIIHKPLKEIPSYSSAAKEFQKKIKNYDSEWLREEEEIQKAIYEVLGKAQKEQRDENTPPLELFYALFTLTNLDNLAFEIEEALIPSGDVPSGWIHRPKNRIRRKDLILTEPSSGTTSQS